MREGLALGYPASFADEVIGTAVLDVIELAVETVPRFIEH